MSFVSAWPQDVIECIFHGHKMARYRIVNRTKISLRFYCIVYYLSYAAAAI